MVPVGFSAGLHQLVRRRWNFPDHTRLWHIFQLQVHSLQSLTLSEKSFVKQLMIIADLPNKFTKVSTGLTK
jgi:hypothetical protein